jgi:hypothetical protein
MITVRMRHMPLLHRCSKCQCLALFCSTLLLCLLSSCAKDYYKSSQEDNKAYGSNGVFTLPVNLNKYNFLSTGGGTKASSSDTTYYINVDSLINWHKCREMIFAGDGYVYTQVPFKSNDEGMYGLCAPTGAKNMKDSIAKIKCYYILLENYKKGERYEYLVTMIPAKQMETQGRDYDFLSKPNFTGLVIYSSLKGEYIREEIYKNGVVYNGKLWSVEEYRNVRKTKDVVVNGGVLDATIVTADREGKFSGNNKLQDWINANRGLTYNFITKNTVTEDDKHPSGGGSRAQTPTPHSKYYVAYSYSSCSGIGSGGDSVSRGTTWISHHPADDKGEDCKFLYWSGGVKDKYSRIAIIPEVNSDYALQAVYISRKDDPNCFIISYLFGNGGMKNSLDSVLVTTKKSNLENVYLSGDTWKVSFRSHTSNKVIFDKNSKFTARCHSHPDYNVILSAADFYSLYNMISNHSVDKYSFSYIIVTYDRLLYLRLTDWSKFQSAFGGIGANGDIDAIKNYWKNFLKDSKIQDPSDDNYIKVFTKLSEFGIGYQMIPLVEHDIYSTPDSGYFYMNYDNSSAYTDPIWDTTIKDCLIKYGLK